MGSDLFRRLSCVIEISLEGVHNRISKGPVGALEKVQERKIDGSSRVLINERWAIEG